jgi:uncharacterized protein with PIN domain
MAEQKRYRKMKCQNPECQQEVVIEYWGIENPALTTFYDFCPKCEQPLVGLLSDGEELSESEFKTWRLICRTPKNWKLFWAE